MSTKRMLLTILAVSVVLLALAFGSQLAGARPSAQQPSPPGARPEHSRGVTIPYPGRLADAAGQPVADGAYDFTFALYDTETGGEPLWSEVQEGVAVQEGGFNALLGNVNDIPTQVLEGGERWLEVAVRGPGEAGFTALAPRQRVSAAAPPAPDSPSAGLTCEHDHFGESWSGSSSNYALRLAQSGSGDGVYASQYGDGRAGFFGINNPSNTSPALEASTNGTGNAIYAVGHGSGDGVYVSQYGDGRAGFFGINNASNTKPALEATTNGSGYAVYATGDIGVYGGGDNGPGVTGRSTNSRGVEGYSTHNYGVFAHSDNGESIYVDGAGKAGVRVYSAGEDGVRVDSAGWAGVYVKSAGSAAIWIDTATYDGLRILNGMGRDYIRTGSNADLDFRVTGTGQVRSDVGFNTPAADFAEMLPAVEGLQAGDVLVIGSDGKLIRSTEPYQASVAGVYSTQPGFVGGQPVEGKVAGNIPLAIMGVVPVKASAENGPIRPGDLLVASSTPGHAMKAGPNPPQGTVIGKALEKWDAGTGVIKMLATLQ